MRLPTRNSTRGRNSSSIGPRSPSGTKRPPPRSRSNSSLTRPSVIPSSFGGRGKKSNRGRTREITHTNKRKRNGNNEVSEAFPKEDINSIQGIDSEEIESIEAIDHSEEVDAHEKKGRNEDSDHDVVLEMNNKSPEKNIETNEEEMATSDKQKSAKRREIIDNYRREEINSCDEDDKLETFGENIRKDPALTSSLKTKPHEMLASQNAPNINSETPLSSRYPSRRLPQDSSDKIISGIPSIFCRFGSVLRALLPSGKSLKIRIAFTNVSIKHSHVDTSIDNRTEENSIESCCKERIQTYSTDSISLLSGKGIGSPGESGPNSRRGRRFRGGGRRGRGGRGRGPDHLNSLSSPLASGKISTVVGKGTGKVSQTEVQGIMGDDGNLYYCHICRDVGDVVCCDGCPKVYHPTCIPMGCDSRKSLDSDDDPWFCPHCFLDKRKSDTSVKAKVIFANREMTAAENKCELSTKESESGRRSSRFRGKQRCTECHQSGGGSMGHCTQCKVSMHVPSCRLQEDCVKSRDNISSVTPLDEEQDKGINDNDKLLPIFCTNCRAEAAVNMEEDERKVKIKIGKNSMLPKAPKSIKLEDKNKTMGSDGVSSSVIPCPNEADKSMRLDLSAIPININSKRKECVLLTQPTSLSKIIKGQMEEKNEVVGKLEKKQKIQNLDNDTVGDISPLPSLPDHDEINDYIPPPPPTNERRPVKAVAPFFFYLEENRIKIERYLSKRNRLFKRTLKGYDRNILLAKECAKWWKRIDYFEKRKYLDISMQDFEDRVIVWKEDKIIRSMLAARDEIENCEKVVICRKQNHDNHGKNKDEDITEKFRSSSRRKKSTFNGLLLSSTQIKCPQLLSNSSKGNNQVLLELLHDTRFHPFPMVNPRQNISVFETQDNSRFTVPFFDVQGPVMTSIGDECIGCVRGWNHYCEVLKRQFPSVEYRSKLQPPISSLAATRIGLGKILKNDLSSNMVMKQAQSPCQETHEFTAEKRRYKNEHSTFLDRSNSRMDDITQFIEATVAVKMSQNQDDEAKISPSISNALSKQCVSTRRKGNEDRTKDINVQSTVQAMNKKINVDTIEEKVFECGHCKKAIYSNMGCLTCRRAQLVSQISKYHPGCKPSATRLSGDYQENNSLASVTGELLKVRTVMLGRSLLNANAFDSQSGGDLRIAAMMIKNPWNPNAILPRSLKRITKNVSQLDDSSCSSVSVSSNSDSEMDISNNDHSLQGSLDLSSYDSEIEKPSISQEQSLSTKESSSSENRINRSPGTAASARLCLRTVTRQKIVQNDSTELPLTENDGLKYKINTEDYEREVTNLHRQCILITTCGIILSIMRRDPLGLYTNLVPKNVEENHINSDASIALNSIKSKVLDGQYPNLCVFILDVRLLCTNSLNSNPPGSIFSTNAKKVLNNLDIMEKRAMNWMTAIKKAHASNFANLRQVKPHQSNSVERKHNNLEQNENGITIKKIKQVPNFSNTGSFEKLRQTWPGAVELLEDGNWLKSQVAADFVRTKENENAYYAALAVRRVAKASEASLAPSPEIGKCWEPTVRRTHLQDEELRNHVDNKVKLINGLVQLKEYSNWREVEILRLLKTVQKHCIESHSSSKTGSVRCDCIRKEGNIKLIPTEEVIQNRIKLLKNDGRILDSRLSQSDGLASAVEREQCSKKFMIEGITSREMNIATRYSSVSIRVSQIHGWGLFADHPFKKGDVVAEYVGEYISTRVAIQRKSISKKIGENDYQFNLNEDLVIDATFKGGHARYINHSCNPNCVAKIIDGKSPNQHLKRVFMVSHCDIEVNDEITYDYQLLLQLDLNSRKPCSCGSQTCRGFMNWNLPESSSLD